MFHEYFVEYLIVCSVFGILKHAAEIQENIAIMDQLSSQILENYSNRHNKGIKLIT
jgi:hypothetical protein